MECGSPLWVAGLRRAEAASAAQAGGVGRGPDPATAGGLQVRKRRNSATAAHSIQACGLWRLRFSGYRATVGAMLSWVMTARLPRRRAFGSGWFIAALMLGCLVTGSYGAMPLKGRGRTAAGAELFSDGKVRTFRVEIREPALTALQQDNRSYVRAVVKEGDHTYADVGVHLKGMGSFRPLNEKPSLVLKFDRYTPDQRYVGLSKIMLNNASQDGTYLGELVATQMFRDAGVPAARVTHAFVELNGRPLGLYVLIEAMNRDFLRQHFRSDKGELYEAYLADIDSTMDQDGGVDTGQKEVKHLLETARLKDPSERWSRLREVFEVDRYLSHLVIELFTSHVDGYAMNRNNYRIYRDPATDRFTMIAHGIDWAFANTGVSIQPPRNSILTRAVLQTPEGWRQFKERRARLFNDVFRVDVLTNRVHAAVAKLKAAARTPSEAVEFENAGTEMSRRIVARAQTIAEQLARPEPVALSFDTNHVARPSGWVPKKDRGDLVSDRAVLEDKPTLHLSAGPGDAIGSWRTKVLLEAGRYRFEGLLRTVQVAASTNKLELGNGAGVRISGDKRTNQLTGDVPWNLVQHEFEVTSGGEEKELVCELRASRGEAWFDAASLRLVRRK